MSGDVPTRYKYVFTYNHEGKIVTKYFYAESQKDATKQFEKHTGKSIDTSVLITRRRF